jgi:hypothetical protein
LVLNLTAVPSAEEYGKIPETTLPSVMAEKQSHIAGPSALPLIGAST